MPSTAFASQVQDLASRGYAAVQGGSTPLVSRVRFRSRITPEITINLRPDGTKEVSGGDPITRKLVAAVRPSFYADTAVGEVALEPGGEPEPNLFPVAAVGGALFTGFALYGVYRFFKG